MSDLPDILYKFVGATEREDIAALKTVESIRTEGHRYINDLMVGHVN